MIPPNLIDRVKLLRNWPFLLHSAIIFLSIGAVLTTWRDSLSTPIILVFLGLGLVLIVTSFIYTLFLHRMHQRLETNGSTLAQALLSRYEAVYGLAGSDYSTRNFPAIAESAIPRISYQEVPVDQARDQLFRAVQNARLVDHSFVFSSLRPIQHDAILDLLRSGKISQGIVNTRLYCVLTYRSLCHVVDLHREWVRVERQQAPGTPRSSLRVFLINPASGLLAGGDSEYPVVNATLLRDSTSGEPNQVLLSTRIRLDRVLRAAIAAPNLVAFYQSYFEQLVSTDTVKQITTVQAAERLLQDYLEKVYDQIILNLSGILQRLADQDPSLSAAHIVGSAVRSTGFDPRHADIDLLLLFDGEVGSEKIAAVGEFVRKEWNHLKRESDWNLHVEVNDGPLKVPPLPASDIIQIHLLIYGEGGVSRWPYHIAVRWTDHRHRRTLYTRPDRGAVVGANYPQEWSLHEQVSGILEGSYGVRRCALIAAQPDQYCYPDRLRGTVGMVVRSRQSGTLRYQELLLNELRKLWPGHQTVNAEARFHEELWRQSYLSWYAASNCWLHVLLAVESLAGTAVSHLGLMAYVVSPQVNMDSVKLMKEQCQCVALILAQHGYPSQAFIEMMRLGVGPTVAPGDAQGSIDVGAYTLSDAKSDHHAIRTALMLGYSHNEFTLLGRRAERLQRFAQQFTRSAVQFIEAAVAALPK